MRFVNAAIDLLRQRKKAYCFTFGPPGTAGHVVFTDLAKFCRAFEGEVVIRDGTVDRDLSLILAGRREAFFRIFQHLHLEPDELAALYRAAVLQQGEPDE